MTRISLAAFVAAVFIASPFFNHARAQSNTIQLSAGSFFNEVTDAYEQGKEAIRTCDKAKFLDALDWLDELAEDAPSMNGADAADESIDELEAAWRKAKCPEISQYDYQLNFWGLGGRLTFNGLPGFFGTENGGGGNRILGVINPSDSGTYQEIGGEVRIELPNLPPPNMMPNNIRPVRQKWDFHTGFNVARADFRDSQDQFDPGAQTLLIPGTGVGPNAAGFSIAAPNGLVNNIHYDYEYRRTSYRAGLGHSFVTPNVKNRVEVRTFAGLEYSRAKVSEIFTASVPNVVIDVAYDTSSENIAWSPYFGIEGSIRPQWLKDFTGSNVALNGGFRYAYNFNDADGRDYLTVTGQNTSPADLDEGRNTHSFGASVGFTVNPDGPVSFTLGGGYERIGNAMKVTRNGQSPTNLSFDEADVWKVGGQFKFRF